MFIVPHNERHYLLVGWSAVGRPSNNHPTTFIIMAEALMLAEIAANHQAAVKKAEYFASDEYKQAELTKMRGELDMLMRLYTSAHAKAVEKAKLQHSVATCVVFDAKKDTPLRAFRLLQAQLTDYIVQTEKQDYWDDFGYHISDYIVTVSRPL